MCAGPQHFKTPAASLQAGQLPPLFHHQSGIWLLCHLAALLPARNAGQCSPVGSGELISLWRADEPLVRGWPCALLAGLRLPEAGSLQACAAPATSWRARGRAAGLGMTALLQLLVAVRAPCSTVPSAGLRLAAGEGAGKLAGCPPCCSQY